MVALALFKLRRQPAYIILLRGFPADGVYGDGILAGGYGKRRAKPVKALLLCYARRLIKADAEAFEASFALLGLIFQTIMGVENAVVLDIGFGTGTLTTKLYERGCSIYGQDFSSRMIALASEKMPNAHLYQGDFSKGLVEPLQNRRYDYIVATYSLHHLTDAQKSVFLSELRDHLKENGKIIIGDVAFETRKDLEQCKLKAGDTWDNDEIYFVVEELRKDFPALSFTQMSECAGVLILD